MLRSSADPIDFFNLWLETPLRTKDRSVVGVMDALESHPSSSDKTSSNYFMPGRRRQEYSGRYRIYGEHQDVWYCFVYEEHAAECNPPVFFESCIGIEEFGFGQSEIIDRDHVKIAETFNSFLWHMLGSYLCLRERPAEHFRDGICGLQFNLANDLKLDSTWSNPLLKEFPALYTCFNDGESLCVEEWGAVFRDAQARERFQEHYGDEVVSEWP